MSSFASEIQRFTSLTEAKLETVVKEFHKEVFNRLLDRSPVKTGHYRANWQVSLNSDSFFELNGTGTDNVRMAMGEIDNYRAKMAGTFYFCNPVPYATRIESGWSQQAPSGVARLIVQEMPAIMASVLARFT